LIIGIRKFFGTYSHPKNQGLLKGLLWDYLCVLSLIFHIKTKQKQGFDFI